MQQIQEIKNRNDQVKVAEIIWNNTPLYNKIDLLASCYYETDFNEPLHPKVKKYSKVAFNDLPKWVQNDMIGSNDECGVHCTSTWNSKNWVIKTHVESKIRKTISELKAIFGSKRLA